MNEMNLLAVGVATIAAFLIGSAWYAVLGEATAEARQADTPATASAASTPSAGQLVLEVVRSLVVATVVAGLAARLGADSWTGGLLLGLVLWVGFPVVLLAGSVLWEGVPPRLALIHAGDWLAKLLAMGAIVGGWA